MKLDGLEPGNFYHIYNRGINGCNLFEKEENYMYFLSLYDKYIDPIANTYAWVLMPNHFHLLVYIKDNLRYKYSMEEIANATNKNSNAVRFRNADRFELNKWETEEKPDSVADLSAFDNKNILPNATKHLSHLFNAYAKYFNKRTNRHGALFERPFKRKLIDSEDYLRQVILYIHNNPIHHGFVSSPIEYGWSSYMTCSSEKETKLKRSEVINWFGDKENFEYSQRNFVGGDNELDYFE